MKIPDLKDIFMDSLQFHVEDKSDPISSQCVFRENMGFIILIELMKDSLGAVYQIQRPVWVLCARAIAQYAYGCQPNNPHSYTSITVPKLFDNSIKIVHYTQEHYATTYPSFRKEYTELGLRTIESRLIEEQHAALSDRQRLEKIRLWCEAHLGGLIDGIAHPGYAQKIYQEYQEAIDAITSSEEQWIAEYHKRKKQKPKT